MLDVIVPGVIGIAATIAATLFMFSNPGAVIALGQALPDSRDKLLAGVILIALLFAPAAIGMRAGTRAGRNRHE